jgi:hypothetical protein
MDCDDFEIHVQVGITTDIVAKGRNAAATSPFTDFTKEQLVQVSCSTHQIGGDHVHFCLWNS